MSILIATPRYNNQSLGFFEDSCYNLKKELNAAGIEHDFLRIGNESLITRARDVIAASFLNDTAFDNLLFIDGDIGFQPADVARLDNLCLAGADVAAGCYRHKSIYSKMDVWVGGELIPLSKFGEPFEVDYAGTGFMMIRRNTFDNLRKLHPEWEYDEGFPLDEKPGEAMKCWGFFQDPIVDWRDKGRFHLSEDFFFCQAVRDAGMKVMMDPDVQLEHWGWYSY
jgi:hypothetical protein